jgi:Holliday junction DNA helicase RuvA
MIAYVSGNITYKSPAYVIIETGGIGYQVNISLTTYSKIQALSNCKLHTHFAVREDAQTLYGFFDPEEKEMFTMLISVSGVGPATAMVILSSTPSEDLQRAIAHDDVHLLEKIKGIGPKTAKRLTLELKDKMAKVPDKLRTGGVQGNNKNEEALSALVMLGFSRASADAVLNKLSKQMTGNESVEEIIKLALRVI